MDPITYLQQRIVALQHEQPATDAGRKALAASIADLERCVEILKEYRPESYATE